MDEWYNLSATETLKKLSSCENGLGQSEADERISVYGENRLPQGKKNGWVTLFLAQFKDLMTLLLIGAAAVSGAVAAITRDGSDLVDTFIIVFIIFLNAVVGFVQQYRADRAIEKLQSMSEGETSVCREGNAIKIPSSRLVPGDVVILKSGDVIPADCRIIRCENFSCDESSLTGESEAVKKEVASLSGTRPLAERRNMIFCSTFAVSGTARAVVVRTGKDTETGKIAQSLTEGVAPSTPLEKSLNVLGKVISISVIVVALIVFVSAIFFRSGSLIGSFMSAVAIAVAAIPEGLPAVVTIIMAMGVQKMSKARVVVRKLHAVETLGSCTCICTDKTGTLTENEMRVEKLIFPIGDENTACDADTENFYMCASSCHSVGGDFPDVIGDGTELAIARYLVGKGKTWRRGYDGVIPFDSDRKMMSVKVGRRAYHKGGFDVILNKCDRYCANGVEYELTPSKKNEFMRLAIDQAGNALRIIGFAYNECSEKISQNRLVFIAFAGLFDPPKKGTREAVESCKRAGIRAVMITGDHAATAAAVAERIGIRGNVTTGAELDSLKSNERCDKICESSVFARVTPTHKREIVEVLQKRGEVVAMTGDGINDAPGLKKADIGIAMGKSGTDVTKDAADMVIADDDFSTIVGAVKEGRRIFANIRKTVCFFLATNAAEVLVVLIAALAFFKVEFLRSTQLLWINLITDSFPVLALGVEKADDDVMKRPPQSAVKSLWNARSVAQIIVFGLVQTILTLTAFVIGLRTSNAVATTMAFLTLSFLELLHSVNVRTDGLVIKHGFRENLTLLVTVIVGIGTSVALCYIPSISSAFGLVKLDLNQWLIVSSLSLALLPIGDVYKLLSRRGKRMTVMEFAKKTA